MPTLRPRGPAPAAALSANAPSLERPHDAAAPRRPAGQPSDPQKYAVQVLPSAIDGMGAFAAEPIAARCKIGEIRGEAVSTAEAFRRTRAAARAPEHDPSRIFMIALSHRRALDASCSSDPLRFANHSCAPNMVLKIQQGRVAFHALREIAPGEELTADYGTTHHGGRLRCRCGAARCKGRL